MNLEVIAADFSDEEVLGVAVGALVLADQRTDPMRLVVESKNVKLCGVTKLPATQHPPLLTAG